MRVYLDHNATSVLRPEARAAMMLALNAGGNASSVHEEGRDARAMIEAARSTVARALGTIAPTVIFTSGGTEAANQAVRCAPVERIIVCAVEHPCVLEAAKQTGKPVEAVPVDANGVVDLQALKAALQGAGGKALVCVMLANNETGVIQPVREVVDLAQAHQALVFCDAVQALGKIPVNFALLGVDMLSISAHKLGGPQGAGALVVRDGLQMPALIVGGGQELRRRAGTENIAAISGFAAAVEASANDTVDLSAMRDEIEAAVLAGPGEVVVFGSSAQRLPNTLCFALPGLEADTALIGFDLEGVAVSSGSACSSGKVATSHVLEAMGVSERALKGAVRVSLGWNSTREHVDRFLEVWQRIAERHMAQASAA